MKPIIVLLFCFFIPYSQLEDIQWSAKWISAPANLQQTALKNLSDTDSEVVKSHPGLKPVLFFRKPFHIKEPVSKAILYCTAKGAFQAYLTKEDPLEYLTFYRTLAPGWTDYNNSIQYYTFDVTYILKYIKNNTLGIAVGTGWYSGYIGKSYNFYGNEESALVQLHITFENGTTTVIASDDTWKVNTGEILYSDLVHGELYYENRKLYNWTNYNYDDKNWSPVLIKPTGTNENLVEDRSPIQRFSVSSAKSYWPVGNDTWVYMFEKPISGGIRLKISYYPFTSRLRIRFGESVFPNGSLYTGNYKTSLNTNTYVLNDIDNRPAILRLEPLFTCNSFQYVEISGFPVVFYSSELYAFQYSRYLSSSAMFSSDNKLISDLALRLQHSISANFISVPTNSPSSDYRVGWLEPAALISWTALYSVENAGKFYKSWLKDVRASQAPSGAYSNIAPHLNDVGDATPGSGFASIIIIYNLYKFYGDIETVKENYVPNINWLKYVISNNPNFLYTNNINEDYGDFANLNADTPKEVIATAYFAYGTLLMSKMSKVLDKTSDQEYYAALHKNISAAFVETYVNSTDGRIKGDTQTGYVLALVSKVLPEELIPKLVQNLVNNIKANNYHLTTGYVGTAFLLPVLADNGYADVAYKLLLQESFPSWGYMLQNYTNGIWERWNSWTEEGGFQGSSLNGLGLGSVGSFLYQYVAGISTDEEEVGFKKIIVKPHINEGINSLESRITTNYGIIVSSMRIGKNISLEILIPKNTTGTLILNYATRTWQRELLPGSNNFNFPLHINQT